MQIFIRRQKADGRRQTADGSRASRTSFDEISAICFLPSAFCRLLSIVCCLLSAVCYGAGQGDAIIAESVRQMAQFNTIRAKIRVDVRVDDQETSLNGSYDEQVLPDRARATNDFQRSKFRLELYASVIDEQMMPGSKQNRMITICNPFYDYSKGILDRQKGKIWKYQSVEGVETIASIRIGVLEDAIKKSSKGQGAINEIKELGGIAGMLNALSDLYNWSDAKETATTWEVQGRMKKAEYDRLLPKFGGLNKKTKQTPPEMPTDIVIAVNRENYFPNHIQYLNSPKEQGGATKTPILQITYIDVVLNGDPIPPTHFSTFEDGQIPDGVIIRDDTPLAIQKALQ